MADEKDWTQVDATGDEVRAWMREHVLEHTTPTELARAAHEHFARPFHLNVLIDMAEKLYG